MKKNILSVIALILALISLIISGLTISAAWDMADRYDAQLAWMDERYASLESRLTALDARLGALETQPDAPIPTEPEATETPADALRFANLVLTDWTFENGTLTIDAAFAQVVAENAALESVCVSLRTEEEALGSLPIDMAPGEASDSYEQDLSLLSFGLPELPDGTVLELYLEAILSDGDALSAYGGSWEYLENNLQMIAG